MNPGHRITAIIPAICPEEIPRTVSSNKNSPTIATIQRTARNNVSISRTYLTAILFCLDDALMKLSRFSVNSKPQESASG